MSLNLSSFDWSSTAAPTPSMPYISLWTDDLDVSRLTPCQLGRFKQERIGGKTDQLWQNEFPGRVTGVKYLIMPVGWVGEWHESPHPQWVIPLAGRWYLETRGGERVEMGPGELHWGQDIGTQGGQGHKSGQLGDVPCVCLMLQFAEPHGSGACPL